MITFIPSWGATSYGGLSNDDLMGQIQAYQESNEPYQIIIRDYIPSLRYFLHRYNLLESNYQSIFDYLQGSQTFTQRQVSLEELNFPEEASYNFNPFYIWVELEDNQIGSINFGEEAQSQITEVHYLKENLHDYSDYYDDRGFISKRKIYQNNQIVSEYFLDVDEQWVFYIDNKTQKCKVNPDNKKFLKKLEYETIESLKWECVEYLLEEAPSQPLLISVDEQSIEWIKDSKFISQMTLSFFKERYPYTPKNMDVLNGVNHEVQAFIVDTEAAFQKIETALQDDSNLHILSPYDTRFTLSKSQEYPKEVIFIDLRRTSSEKNLTLIKILTAYCAKSFIDKNRQVQLVFRTSDNGHKYEVEEQIRSHLEKNYKSSLLEIEFFQQLEKEGENNLESFITEKISEEAKWLRQFQEDIEINVLYNDDDFFKIMNTARLIISLGIEPDLFTQIAGLSSGIPQIVEQKTRYIEHRKNGWILNSDEGLHEALSFYLDTLKNWQESRVYSVQQIKEHSGIQLQRKLSRIVGENIGK